MESHGQPNRIHVSEAVAAALGEGFVLEERGSIEVKGKGPMRTFWLEGLRGRLSGRREKSSRPL